MLTEKQWSKITVSGPDDCWIWTGACDGRGYGQIRVSRTQLVRVARLMLAWSDGIEIPDKQIFVLHGCDNPPCVNPLHLKWGSHRDNMDDAMERKRFKNNFKIGQEHSHAKLTEEKVLAIRKRHNNGEKKRALSNEYKVSFQTISHIVNKITWKHI